MPQSSAKLELVVASDPGLLLERAADGFLTPGTPTPPYLLALRQGGLRDDLLALAAARGLPGWIDPALCTFHELPEWLGTTKRKPCDDFERAVILGGVLRRLGGDVFGRKLKRPEDFLRAIDRLVGELVADGVTPHSFRSALEARRDRDEFERDRDSELAFIYSEYTETLAATGRRDGRDAWLDCAAAIAASPESLARGLGGRREVRIVGLNDLRGGWRHLLAALELSPAIDRIAIYTSEPIELGDLRATVTRLDEPETTATRLFGDVTLPGAIADCIAAPDAERELEEVARRIRLLADGGVPLTSIAVVARQARPCVDLAISALIRYGIPVTARRRIGLREIPVVRAVRALFAAAAERWSRHALVELAEQPYFASELDARLINFAGFRRRVVGLDAWERALRELASEAEAEERLADPEREGRRAGLPPSSRAREAADGLAAFAARATVLDGTCTLAEWVGWLAAFLADDPWRIRAQADRVPGDRFDVVRIDLAGWRALSEIVTGWRTALDAWGGAEDRLGAAEFAAQLDDLLDGDVALWTGTMRGVRVLEALAATCRSFDHVFVVGLEAGRFPLRAPGSPLHDEWERRELAAAGLPFDLRETWERRERELFRALVASARRSLTVSYARLDSAGREVVRSTFVDRLAEIASLRGEAKADAISSARVVTPGIRLYDGAGIPVHARRVLSIERQRESGALSPHNGLIEDPALVAWLGQEFGDDRLWSPTQLESFAKCPWSYFGARLLGVGRLDDPDEEMDSATRGVLLHDALRRFFEAAKARVDGPVFLRASDLEWAQPMMAAALDATIADAAGRKWLGHPALAGARRQELGRMLARYLASEAAEHEDMFDTRKKNAPKMVRTAVTEHERPFTDVVLERDGVRFRFRGSIDRVERGVDDRFDSGAYVAAVDYKTTKYSAPGGGHKDAWTQEIVLQVPLYAYALMQAYPDARIARVEYRAIKHCEPVHRLELYQVGKAGVAANEVAAAQMERALSAVAGHVRRARGGEFPAEPAESSGCPDFCASIDICRLPGGPRSVGGW